MAVKSVSRKLSSFQAFRSYGHVTRLLMGICVGLGFLCMTLATVIVGLLPLKEIRPMLIGISDKNQQVVRIEPLKDNVQGIHLLIEKLLMHYVKQRETIDGITESARFQEVAYMTDKNLWADHWNTINPSNQKSPLKAFFDNNVRREVHVVRCVSLQASARNTYRIEWSSLDRRNGEEIKHQRWVTTLVIAFEPTDVRVEDQYINPLGLKVIHYTIAKKEDNE